MRKARGSWVPLTLLVDAFVHIVVVVVAGPVPLVSVELWGDSVESGEDCKQTVNRLGHK